MSISLHLAREKHMEEKLNAFHGSCSCSIQSCEETANSPATLPETEREREQSLSESTSQPPHQETHPCIQIKPPQNTPKTHSFFPPKRLLIASLVLPKKRELLSFRRGPDANKHIQILFLIKIIRTAESSTVIPPCLLYRCATRMSFFFPLPVLLLLFCPLNVLWARSLLRSCPCPLVSVRATEGETRRLPIF